MPASRLPPLDFNTRVSAETAKQDKIELSVQHGTIRDSDDDVAMFLHFLGTPPEDQRVA